MQKPDLQQFPTTPGVYLFKDAGGRILYVGKARRLRHRIASYFREEAALSPKTRVMLSHAHSLDILGTGTEKEALLLEAGLIKKHRPRYNIVLRDDKEYLLFRIGTEHPFPRVEIIRHNRGRSKTPHKGKTFGPFSSGSAARETWRLIHKHFPLRRCKNIAFANRTRPCLYQHMGQCLGPCVLPVTQEEYRALLHKVEMLLEGRSRELIHTLRKEMQNASDALLFEQAARLRDQLHALERTLERQSVVLPHKADIDLIGVAQSAEGLALGIVFVREGLLVDGRNFFWPGLTVEDTPELLLSFPAQFYIQGGAAIPPRIVVPWLPTAEESDHAADDAILSPVASVAIPVADALLSPNAFAASIPATAEYSGIKALEAALAELRGSTVRITPPHNKDEDNLVLMAVTNAREAIKTSTAPAMAELLAERLHTGHPVRRIEIVDISHTSGRQTRAGMVVFEDEEPKKSDYRAYALDDTLAAMSAHSGDDYAALAAWAARRVASGPPWADLVLVDGGKGQLAAVERAFITAFAETSAGVSVEASRADSAKTSDPTSAESSRATSAKAPDTASSATTVLPFALAAIAKARDEDGKTDRRAGNIADRIFLPGRSNPVNLRSGSPELLFLQRVRDTAHDFVLGRHRKARAAAALTGELTRLPGVGPALARVLYEHFGSLAAMAEAGEAGLTQISGVGKTKAAMLNARLTALLGEKK